MSLLKHPRFSVHSNPKGNMNEVNTIADDLLGRNVEGARNGTPSQTRSVDSPPNVPMNAESLRPNATSWNQWEDRMQQVGNMDTYFHDAFNRANDAFTSSKKGEARSEFDVSSYHKKPSVEGSRASLEQSNLTDCVYFDGRITCSEICFIDKIQRLHHYYGCYIFSFHKG